MASYVDLYSLWRDRDTYPNACDFEVLPSQIKHWFKESREVRAFPQKPNARPLEFVDSITLLSLTLPYDDRLAVLPRLYVDFHSRLYNDQYLLNQIDGKIPNARFICLPERIQYDIDGTTPIWIHYKSHTDQVMRFNRDDTVTLKVMNPEGIVLPYFIEDDPTEQADITQQSLTTFKVIPYIRDNEYSHHTIDPKV